MLHLWQWPSSWINICSFTWSHNTLLFKLHCCSCSSTVVPGICRRLSLSLWFSELFLFPTLVFFQCFVLISSWCCLVSPVYQSEFGNCSVIACVVHCCQCAGLSCLCTACILSLILYGNPWPYSSRAQDLFLCCYKCLFQTSLFYPPVGLLDVRHFYNLYIECVYLSFIDGFSSLFSSSLGCCCLRYSHGSSSLGAIFHMIKTQKWKKCQLIYFLVRKKYQYLQKELRILQTSAVSKMVLEMNSYGPKLSDTLGFLFRFCKVIRSLMWQVLPVM